MFFLCYAGLKFQVVLPEEGQGTPCNDELYEYVIKVSLGNHIEFWTYLNGSMGIHPLSMLKMEAPHLPR